MTPSLNMALFIFCAQFLAYIIKGLVGFGNPLISAPLLSMRLDSVVITPGSLPIDMPVNAFITWRNRHNFQWRRILPLLIFNVMGVFPGTLLLRLSLPWVIKVALGIVVVFLGLEMASREVWHVKPKGTHPALQMAVSFFSGMCAGLFGINMFIVAFLQRTAKDYDEFKGSICFLFLGENVFRMCSYLAGGLINRDALFFALASAPAAILGLRLASWLGRHLDEQKLRRGAIVLFLLGGVSIIVKATVLRT